jgi:hypothetical protein
MVLPAAARAAVSLKRGRDRIRDLVGHIGSGRCPERCGRASWRCIHGSVEEIAELLLRGLQNRRPVAPPVAGRTLRRGAA